MLKKSYLYIFLLLFIIILFSCKKTVEEYNITETQTLRIETYKELHFVPDERNLKGKLLLTDVHGTELNYDVENWNNTIDVPFGFYKATVYGFEGYSYNTFDLIATGGNREIYNSCRLSKLPDFDVEIDHFAILGESSFYGFVKLDSTNGQWILFIWGTNEENPEEDQIKYITRTSLPSGADEDGFYHAYFGDTIRDDILYKYYSITAEPWWGYWDTRVHHWYELVLD